MFRFCQETVTGSGNEIRASNGPMFAIAPLNARAKPAFVISLKANVNIDHKRKRKVSKR